MFLKLQNCVSIEIIKATRLSVVNTWTCTYSVYLYVGAHVLKTEQNISMIKSLGEKKYNVKSSTNENWKKKKKEEYTQKYRSGRIHTYWYSVLYV